MGIRGTVRLALSFFDAEALYGLTLFVGLPAVAMLLLSLALIHWDGHAIVVCGQAWNRFLIPGGREPSLREFFDEMLSFGWLLLGLPLIYSGLLTPIANSFTINGSLWLKLLVPRGIIVQFARILTSLTFVTMLVLCGILWTIPIALRHALDLKGLMRVPLGIVGQALFSSSLLLLVLTLRGSREETGSNRNTFAFIALFLPYVLFLLWKMLLGQAGAVGDIGGSQWIPWVFPFYSAQAIAVPHALACIVCAIGFYSASLLSAVARSHFAQKSVG